MIGLLTKIGVLSQTVKEVEQTETGKLALSVMKIALVSVLGIVGLVLFFSIRNTNRMFSQNSEQIKNSISKAQFGNSSANIENVLFEYFRSKNNSLTNEEIDKLVNHVLNEIA